MRYAICSCEYRCEDAEGQAAEPLWSPGVLTGHMRLAGRRVLASGCNVNHDALFEVKDNQEKEGSPEKHPLIAVVGPCASGKSTLVEGLRERGYNAREVAQEHSYVDTMWQRVSQPDLLIYLGVSQEVASQRRASEADSAWWEALERRLHHARQHADLCVRTDNLGPEEVLDRALGFLEHHAV